MDNQNNEVQALQEAVDILRGLRGYLSAHRINGPTMLCTDGKALNNADDEVLRALKLLVPLSKLLATAQSSEAVSIMPYRSSGHDAKPLQAERDAWEADMVIAGAKHLGGDCWEWDVPDFEFRLWQVATRRQPRAEDKGDAK